MKKNSKLKLCNWSILPLAVAILISAIQLELTGSQDNVAVWLHVIIGLLFVAGIAWHIYLHFAFRNWFACFRKLKSQATRILWWLFLACVLSGIIAMLHRMLSSTHSPVGGVHGKIGLLMMAFVIAHICKRLKFYRRSKKSSAQSRKILHPAAKSSSESSAS